MNRPRHHLIVKKAKQNRLEHIASQNCPEEDERTAEQPLERSNNETTDDEEAPHPDDSEYFVIDLIISHNINRYCRHNPATLGEPLYSLRWYDYGPADHTWEPTAHIRRSKIIALYKKKTLKLPTNFNHATNSYEQVLSTFCLILRIY